MQIGCVECVLYPVLHYRPNRFVMWEGTSYCDEHFRKLMANKVSATQFTIVNPPPEGVFS
jgi:hypothetical protein